MHEHHAFFVARSLSDFYRRVSHRRLAAQVKCASNQNIPELQATGDENNERAKRRNVSSDYVWSGGAFRRTASMLCNGLEYLRQRRLSGRDDRLASHSSRQTLRPVQSRHRAECWVAPSWAVTAGYFHNSLSRPSFYGGGVWAPEFAHWGYVRLAAMGGIISGYNYGKWGLGSNQSVGPVAAPLIMAEYGHIGANIILIPPIPSSDLPFTIGFMLRYKF